MWRRRPSFGQESHPQGRQCHMISPTLFITAALLNGFQYLADGGRQFEPCALFRRKLFLAAARQVVKLGATVVLRSAPASFDPAAALQPVQRGIQRALLHLKNVAGYLLDALGDGPSMLRPQRQSLEDQEVQGALGKINALFRHVFYPSASTGR